ncbi:monofunctional biosynthetic peptidoglycan transglycosylase [Gynurincola endophyticus]|jgi:monofunctional biosynthetic peptidoglycan transglycosylase|uniref:monofunctional biosynthetic peptidoglycan transglycosylase n=1 Tax=Gynurincola endophyticus TaxID=2479004 RepID=UPI000F8D6D45|nr:monofunctional biosynthetic peptidoglycan transglycosylase [Gynurincola endophyticus]
MPIKRRGLGLRILRFLKKLFIFLVLFQFFYILLIRWVNPPITFTQLGSVLKFDGLKRDYVDLDEMSSYAKLAVIASEDQLFAEHRGFDWKGIEKAIEYNKTNEGKKVRGASTISQQVAKNVFLWQGRSWARKGLEVYFTFMIETFWPKKRILELYLNISEMGTGVYGIEAAAQHYFQKPASKLTRKEAALIAACLPNPKVYTVQPQSKYVSRKYPWILKQMTNIQKDEKILALIQ